MNSSWRLGFGIRLVVALSTFVCLANLFAQTKVIRLRSGSLTTSKASTSTLGGAQFQAIVPAEPRLYLVQFTDRVQETWRGALTQRGVEFIRYVPEDAFIARFSPPLVGWLQSLPFVHWVGPYSAEYKIDSRFRDARVLPEVQVMLTPGASGRDRVLLRRRFATLSEGNPSRFGTVLRGRMQPAQLAEIAASESVLWIEAAASMKLLDEVSSKIVAGDDGASGSRTLTQQAGWDGTGVVVAVADSGLHAGEAASMHPDLFGRVDDFFFYGTLDDASDEHSHGTHVTGIIAGDATVGETDEFGYLYGLGIAPGAHVVAQRIFDGIGNYHPPATFETLTRDAVRAGADIGSNSWGDDVQGRYDISAAEFDGLVRDADFGMEGDQPYILEFSAGNAGPGAQTIASPAVGKNVIATGASQNNRPDLFIYSEGQEAMADFSSRGPCEDGRIKPDLVAPGTWIASLKSIFASDENAWLPISENYLYQGGTSQAGPQVSGGAAVLVQYWRAMNDGRTPSPAMVKALLLNTAVDMDDEYGTRPIPNDDEGWGRMELGWLVEADRAFDFVDQTELLRVGDVYERRVVVASGLEPFRVTLVYTDYPGFPGALPALVNDLDLEVVAPDQRVYLGNRFQEGFSAPGGNSPDRLNNVEAVYLNAPLPGEYIIRIHGYNIVADARRETPVVDQDFALVTSGDLPLPGEGVLFFDRGAYGVPADIGVKLVDFDLVAADSVTVTVLSDTEPEGETLRLSVSSSPGVFTNRMAATTGIPASDGQLQVSHNDTILAVYQDASPLAERNAVARADLEPPVIFGLGVTNRYGKMVISWETDEPTSAEVAFGVTTALGLQASDPSLRLHQEIELGGLEPDQVYFFSIASADEAGNRATDDNGGAFYSFTAVGARALLLVDAYRHDPESYDSLELPLTTYTDALDTLGISYDVWPLQVGDLSPAASDLAPFSVVMWRINDSFYDGTSPTGAEQAAISEYLANGGSFFMASMEVLTRVGDSSFRTNVLHAGVFKQNTDLYTECLDCDEDRGVPLLAGIDDDPISGGMSFSLDYAAYPFLDLSFIGLPNIGPDVGDTFVPTTNAAAIFEEVFSGRAAGMRFPRTGVDAPGRVVFLSFPLDAIPVTGDSPNTRAEVLGRALNFLSPGLNGEANLALDRSLYTVPSQMVVEVFDSSLGEAEALTVRFWSESDAVGTVVALQETPRAGLFRGSVVLVSEYAEDPAGQLVAAHEDALRAEYYDESTQRLLHVSALTDAVGPEIWSVEGEADYESATVRLEISKPSDALVQYWETTTGFPNNRTAYEAEFREDHELTLHGLRPNRSYLYQVAVRDAAGNTTVDDNDGQFFTLRTLTPRFLPWFDDLEGAREGWSVINGDASGLIISGGFEFEWELGVPQNELATEGHSPTNAWGTSLNGYPGEYADTSLISPAIDLSGGNRVTLRFWSNYDFSDRGEFDLYEYGRLLLMTNSLGQPIELGVFEAWSNGWEEQVYDLSPYLGKTVFLVWEYQQWSWSIFEEVPARPGWLIDDISVEVLTIPEGTLEITSNLAQARFTVTGPVSHLGQGWSTTLANLPLGDYQVTFEPVAFYHTPGSSSVTLAEPGVVPVSGQYLLVDGNGNNLADDWEQETFGEVSDLRSAETDSDEDGMTDGEEFIAGTDANAPDSYFPIPEPSVTDDSVLFTLSAQPGKAYRVLGSEDLFTWTPVSDWTRAGSTTVSVSVPRAPGVGEGWYRLEVAP